MTTTLRPAAERGHAEHGWLSARHSFSFADYFDPAWSGFSDLRVLNQDVVAPATGFGTHPHRDMEIVTWVLEGRLTHRDSMGRQESMGPGEVQVMSAGTGVTHSEFNASEDEPLELLQMWILPGRTGEAPRYGQRLVPDADLDGRLALLVGPDHGPRDVRDSEVLLSINQDARFHAGRFAAGQRDAVELDAGRRAWVHVGRGRALVNGVELGPGDGLALEDEPTVTVEGLGTERPADVVLWDLR